jgi:Rieske Fe-S protein
MDRKEFIKLCGFACLGGSILTPLLAGCSGPPMLTGEISGDDILIPADSFVVPNSNPDNATKFRDCVIVSNKELEFPICVFRFSDTRYSALWMRCTHQGAELNVFGDRLECPAHGSAFTSTGAVLNGPAALPLRSFPVTVENNFLRISLKKA